MSSPIKCIQLYINFQWITFLYSDQSRSLGVRRRRETGTLGDWDRSENSMDDGEVEYGWDAECEWNGGDREWEGQQVRLVSRQECRQSRHDRVFFIMKSARKNSSNRSLCPLGRRLHECCWECVRGRRTSLGTGGKMKRGRIIPSQGWTLIFLAPALPLSLALSRHFLTRIC